MGNASGAQDAASKPATKKPTAKELRNEDIRLEMEQTRKSLGEATFDNDGDSESDDHGSEDGIPPEVAAEDTREVAREAGHLLMEERTR